MLAIGRALMARPKLLLLDEPSMGLAPIFVEKIFEIIAEINAQGTPILLVEQNALMALDVANRGYVLETGEIALEGAGEGAARRTSRSARRTWARSYAADLEREVGRAEQVADPRLAAGAAVRHLERARDPVRRHEAERAAPPGGRGSRRRRPRRAGRAPAGSCPSRRRAGADGRRGRRGTPRARSSVGRGLALAVREVLGGAPVAERMEERAVRILVPCAKWRESRCSTIAVPPSTTGKASRQSRSASPSATVATVIGFEPLARRVLVLPGHADHDRVERLVERGRAPGDPAEKRLRVRDGRRPREGGDGGQLAADVLEQPAPDPEGSSERRRSGERATCASERVLVRVAAKAAREPRRVQHE